MNRAMLVPAKAARATLARAYSKARQTNAFHEQFGAIDCDKRCKLHGTHRDAINKNLRTGKPTFGCAFWTMRLHRDVSIQMIECAVCLLATVPAALVHAFDFFVSPARALVLLCTWDWHERVDRG